MKFKKKSGRQTNIITYIDFFCPQLSVFEASIIWGQLSQVTQLLGKMWLHPVHIKKFLLYYSCYETVSQYSQKFCLFQFITNSYRLRMVSKSSLGQILCSSYCDLSLKTGLLFQQLWKHTLQTENKEFLTLANSQNVSEFLC